MFAFLKESTLSLPKCSHAILRVQFKARLIDTFPCLLIVMSLCFALNRSQNERPNLNILHTLLLLLKNPDNRHESQSPLNLPFLFLINTR